MAHDPYIRAWSQRRANRRRAEGASGLLRAWALPLLAMGLLVPLVRQVFLGFLALPMGLWAEGVQAVTLRAGLVVTGWLSMDVYSALIRGEGRTVLALLPVNTRQVVRAQLIELAVSRSWLIVGGAVVFAPVAVAGAPGVWAAMLAVLAGAYALGLTVSATVILFAVGVAEDPRWAFLLDLARSNNPRAQAAFLYAPGVVLLVAGGLTVMAANAVPGVVAGDPIAWGWLLAPFIAAVIAWQPVPGLARAQWFRGSAVISEIDARYATLEAPEDRLSVYLDWVVRFLPGKVRVYALNDLRHGWRQRRTLVTGAWLLGALSLAAGWTGGDHGPGQVIVAVVLGTFVVAANGALLTADQRASAYLSRWLPPPGLPGAQARLVVLVLWAAPVTAGGAFATAVFRGAEAAAWVAGWGIGTAALAAMTAVVCGALGRRAMAAYAPVAGVLAVGVAAWLGGAG